MRVQLTADIKHTWKIALGGIKWTDALNKKGFPSNVWHSLLREHITFVSQGYLSTYTQFSSSLLTVKNTHSLRTAPCQQAGISERRGSLQYFLRQKTVQAVHNPPKTLTDTKHIVPMKTKWGTQQILAWQQQLGQMLKVCNTFTTLSTIDFLYLLFIVVRQHCNFVERINNVKDTYCALIFYKSYF